MADFFKDKCFIVTGASSGIGRAIAKLLAEKGAKVSVMARTTQKLEDLKKEAGENILVQPGDVVRATDCEEVVRKSVKVFGKLDGLIHNAGVGMRGIAIDTDIKVYKDLMAVNFFSMLYLYKPVLNHIARTKGHIVAVSSMMGRYSTQERSGYNASKHALQGFMNSIRLEVFDKGVHVMVVSPGFVKTNASLNALTADGTPYNLMDGALEKGLKPEELAAMTIAGIQKRKRDLHPGGSSEKLGLFLSKWAPGMLDNILLKRKIK